MAVAGKERKSLLSRVGAAWDWWERLRSIVDQIGLRKMIAATSLSVAYAAAAWFFDNVPWYISGILLLAVCFFLLLIVHRVQIIRATAKFNPRDYQKFGQDLTTLSQDIFRFLAERQREQADAHRTHQGGRPDFSAWQADRDFEQVTGRIFFERFGSKSLGSLALLKRLGVEIPTHMIFSANYRPHGLPQFLGLMGDLLSRGNILDAVEISKDRNFMWQIEH